MTTFSNYMASLVGSTKRMTSIVVILMAFSIYLFIDASNGSFAFDEEYISTTIQYSFSDIWSITTEGIQPPFYFFMLKIFTLIFGESLLALRVFSNLGILAIFLTGLFPISKIFGSGVSLLFISIVALLPISQYLGGQVQMYSWCMFFNLANAVAAYKVYRNTTKFNNFILLLTVLCASYTHYYSFIGSIIIFVVLLVYQINKKKPLINTVIVILLFLIAYSFWIPQFSNQINTIVGSEWITTLNLKNLVLLIYYFFSPKDPAYPYTILNLFTWAMVLLVMFFLIGTCIVLVFKQYEKLDKKKIEASFLFMAVFFIPIIAAIVVSYLIKPILIPQYMTCLLGSLVLGVSILLFELYESGSEKSRNIIFGSLCMLLVLSVTRFFSEREYSNRMRNKIMIQEKINFPSIENMEGDYNLLDSSDQEFDSYEVKDEVLYQIEPTP